MSITGSPGYLTYLKNKGICTPTRRDAGAAERDGLENRCGGDSTQGSNPCPSARFFH